MMKIEPFKYSARYASVIRPILRITMMAVVFTVLALPRFSFAESEGGGDPTPPDPVVTTPTTPPTPAAPAAISDQLQNTIAQAQTNQATLQNQITQDQTNQAALQNQITTLNGEGIDTTAQQAQLATLNNDITVLQTSQTNLNSDIASMQSLEAQAQSATSLTNVDALQAQLTALQTQVAAHVNQLNAAIAALNPADPNDAATIAALQQAYAGISNALNLTVSPTTGQTSAGGNNTATLTNLIGNVLSTLLGALGSGDDGIGDDEDPNGNETTAIQDTAHLGGIDNSLNGNYVSGLKGMTEQLTTTIMEQALIIGTFMDAQNQLEAQRLLQDMGAQSNKSYEPSTQMCILGTNVRSLAMSDQKGKANTYILSNAMLTRSMLSNNQEGGEGPSDDVKSRISQYEDEYCNPNDNDGMLGNMANSTPFFCKGTGGPQAKRNRDIDFTGVVDGPLTLDVDFTDTNLSGDEEDVLAMSRNLFSNDLVDAIPSDLLTQGPKTNMGPGAWVFQNWRSLEAIRGVAENSFAHLVGMKAKGGAQVYPFMQQILQSMGMTSTDAQQLLSPASTGGGGGSTTNPSYFAQMDVLTKRIYMSPDFYVNLFTQPANVERLGATLQAIKLMNDRDRFEASLRREMLISLIVEMKLREQERNVDNNLIGTTPALFVQ